MINMALPEKIQIERNTLVEKLIKDIKNGTPFFWDPGFFNSKPKNLIQSLNGKTKLYNGINAIRLMFSSYENGFTDSRWATFKQAEANGYKIKKGSKGTHIEYWQYVKDVLEINPKTGKKEPVYEIDPKTGEKRKQQVLLDHPLVKSYVVFNAEQIEGIEKEVVPNFNHTDVVNSMENMIKNSEAPIYCDQKDRNYYSVNKDEIHVVPREIFNNIDEFYATVSHEIAHSTGAETRLNRDTVTNTDGFGGENYAKEELRAELTSLFIEQKYNIRFDDNHYKNHAAYLQSWIKVLQNDPNELFRAAIDAEKAMDYIEDRMILKNLSKDISKDKNVDLDLEVNEKKIATIKNAGEEKLSQSTAKQYLSKAKNLLNNNTTWKKEFNEQIIKSLLTEGRTPNSIKLALKKYSPTKIDEQLLSKVIKSNFKNSLSR